MPGAIVHPKFSLNKYSSQQKPANQCVPIQVFTCKLKVLTQIC